MSFNEWKKYKWGDIITLEYGKGLKGYKDSNESIPVYGTNGLIGYTEKSISNRDGVIIGRKGAYRGVHYSAVPFYVIDTAYYLNILDENILNMKFAYYHLLTKDINSMDSGSAIPSTSRNDFYSMISKIPPIEEQKAIAKILSDLDDKIEVNNKINKNLEDMAQAIFKSWFVDFEFPNEEGKPYKSSDGEINELYGLSYPNKWVVSNVFDNVELVNNKNKDKENLPVLTVTKESKFLCSEEYFTRQVYSKNTSNYKIVNKYDIAYNPSRANIGSIAMLKDFDKGIVSPMYVVFRLNEKILPFYFDYYMKLPGFIDKIRLNSSGTTRQNFDFKALKYFTIVIPPIDIQNKCYKVIKSIEDLIDNNIKENEKLSNLRDTLLPKLMSGEIRVPIG